MATEPRRYAVADLIAQGALYIGDGYRAKNEELSPNGLPFARAGNIDGAFRFEASDRFPREGLSRVGLKVSQPGDVVFTSKGTVGRFALVRPETEQFVYSPQLTCWRSLDREMVEPKFLFYWMQGREFQLQYVGVKGQTDMADYVSLHDQRRMHITLPCSSEQKEVAELLGALDDKIELNRRMNQTLEAMAAALFRAWFVDFDPSQRQGARGKLQRGEMDNADLFSESLIDSAIGPIPNGWRLASLPEVVEINPSRYLRKGDSAPYLDMQNMPTQGYWPLGWVQRVFGSGTKFQNGDALVARITPCLENGKTAYVDFLRDGQVGWGSTEYIVLRPKPPLPLQYGYYLARSEEFRIHAIRNMSGSSGRQRVPVSCFDRYFVAVPPSSVAEAFGQLVRPWMRLIRANSEQMSTLGTLRDTLLPKLLSGELRVRDAESLVGAAV